MRSDDFALVEILGALEKSGIEAIIVGLAAAALQGAPVTTQDVDFLLRDTQLNRRKVTRFCEILGATARAYSDRASTVAVLGGPVPIDLIFGALTGGLRFETVRSRSVRIPIGERVALVASLEDIIQSKEAANRTKDLAQLPILRDTLQVRAHLKRKASRERKRPTRRTRRRDS